MPSWRAISFVVRPRATSHRISTCLSVSLKSARERSRRTRRDTSQPTSAPNASQAGPRMSTLEGAAAACAAGVSSARALQSAALVRTDHLVLEALEEELSTAAGAQGLVGVVPHRGLPTARGVRGAQLLKGGTTGAGRHEDLSESMSAEVAIKLSSNSHSDLQTGTTPRTVPGRSLFQYPRRAVRVPLMGTQNGRRRMGGGHWTRRR